jgi:hypothetical protein
MAVVNNMKNIVLLSCIVILTSCSKPTVSCFYNDSTMDLRVLLLSNQQEKLSAHTETCVDDGKFPFETIKLLVSNKTLSKQYFVNYVMPILSIDDRYKYVEHFHFQPDRYHYWIDSNLNIFMIKPSTKEPAKNLYPQPEGFPIKPLKEVS